MIILRLTYFASKRRKDSLFKLKHNFNSIGIIQSMVLWPKVNENLTTFNLINGNSYTG